MLYMVECGFSDPDREADWNRFYSGPKLGALLENVPGFLGSQRFRSTNRSVVRYIAIHEITSADVLESDAYKRAGGGSFLEYSPFITDWRRTAFTGLDRLEAVRPHQRLVVIDSDPVPLPGVEIHWLKAGGLANDVASRGIAVMSEDDARSLATRAGEDIRLFEPISPLMRGQP